MIDTETQAAIQQRAITFSNRWKELPGDEEQQKQDFLIDFFKIWNLNIIGMSTFERRVTLKDGYRGRIDCLLEGVILVEQKNTGMNLDVAYEQALNYIPGLKPEVVPQYVMVCDFRTFRLYDEKRYSRPSESRGPEYIEFTLEKLHEHVDAFNFLIGAYTELREKNK